jgi:hypothetical protein
MALCRAGRGNSGVALLALGLVTGGFKHQRIGPLIEPVLNRSS